MVRSGIRPWILLKWERFAQATQVLGCETDSARAKLFDFDHKTIHNLKNGGPVGDKTVAKVLAVVGANATALAAHKISATFDEFFQVMDRAS